MSWSFRNAVKFKNLRFFVTEIVLNQAEGLLRMTMLFSSSGVLNTNYLVLLVVRRDFHGIVYAVAGLPSTRCFGAMPNRSRLDNVQVFAHVYVPDSVLPEIVQGRQWNQSAHGSTRSPPAGS